MTDQPKTLRQRIAEFHAWLEMEISDAEADLANNEDESPPIFSATEVECTNARISAYRSTLAQLRVLLAEEEGWEAVTAEARDGFFYCKCTCMRDLWIDEDSKYDICIGCGTLYRIEFSVWHKAKRAESIDNGPVNPNAASSAGSDSIEASTEAQDQEPEGKS